VSGETDDSQAVPLDPSRTREQRWPGERLGLPESGRGSVAGWGRRVLALAIDWILSMLAVGAFVGSAIWTGGGSAGWAPLAVFAAEKWVLTALLGSSAGQLLTSIRVVRLSPEPLGLWRPLVRSVLVCLVIPPVIYDQDQRGLHDLAVGTVTVKR
jgi:RDD family